MLFIALERTAKFTCEGIILDAFDDDMRYDRFCLVCIQGLLGKYGVVLRFLNYDPIIRRVFQAKMSFCWNAQ